MDIARIFIESAARRRQINRDNFDAPSIGGGEKKEEKRKKVGGKRKRVPVESSRIDAIPVGLWACSRIEAATSNLKSKRKVCFLSKTRRQRHKF